MANDKCAYCGLPRYGHHHGFTAEPQSPTDDLLERANNCTGNVYQLVDEMADEIERRMAEIERLRSEIERLRATIEQLNGDYR